MKTARGFTLLELMIVVAIIGILSMVAYPTYTAYIERNHRSAAQQFLLTLGTLQEQYVIDNRAYADALSDLGYADTSEYPEEVKGMYTVTIDNATYSAGYYKLVASPVSGSRMDGTGDLTLDSTGVRNW